MKLFNILEAEGGFKHNVANLSLAKARDYAEKTFKKSGKDLNELIPDFDKNYQDLQKATKKALDVPRIQMPVIEPENMQKFYNDLKNGRVDIFKPYAKGKFEAPVGLDKDKEKADEWINLGYQDGKKEDDTVKAKWTSIPAKKLLPTQSQIWLEKLITNIDKFGVPTQGSSATESTIIVSKEGYILDGHHRWATILLSVPNLKMKALFIPIDIKTLLKIGRSYGNAIGNSQKQ